MKNLLFLSLLLTCLSSYAQQYAVTEEKSGSWHGFTKTSFKIDGVDAWYASPAKPLPGNPWIWRAYFPDWHVAMDSILLQRGFYVAYIEAKDLYGAPKAMMLWDKLYDYLVNQKQFAAKVALEGVSRGGLYVYGWAKRNPEKVSCIFAEAPVCDFTSWPGKLKNGSAASDWKKLLLAYNFTEQQAQQYNDQPKDNLDALAAFKVPILHVIRTDDKYVPYADNTKVLVANYIEKGGPATVIPMTRGEQDMDGHHFTIEQPAALADWVYANAYPVKTLLRADEYIRPYGNLNNFLHRIQTEKKATIAFLGGSITNMKGWRDKVGQYLTELYPEVSFTFINAGIPSLGSLPHAFRVQHDVLDEGRVDLMFIESAVNDHGNGTTELQQRKALEGIIRHARKVNPAMDMVMMAFVDEDKIADYNNGRVPLEIKVHDDLANYYKLPFINLAEEVSRKIAANEFNWQYDFKNLHPSPFGQEIYFGTIKRLLQKQLIGMPASRLQTVTLPVALQKLNYEKGRYVAVTQVQKEQGFAIVPDWRPADSAHTRPGFVKVPVLEGKNAGDSFEFTFTGTTVGLATLAGPDAGIISYSIDGKPAQQVDLYTKWSKNLHLPWYVLLGDDLSNKKHTVKVSITDTHNTLSKGNACRIVYFLVNE
ncbi:MAG: prolyl oligopeptidase family serine peptidase [Filimonas sp.]|nr:prolyl oligopeptidase family serine peptidase [Filimonas sp.]